MMTAIVIGLLVLIGSVATFALIASTQSVAGAAQAMAETDVDAGV